MSPEQKSEQDRHYAWRKEMREQLPELASKVFSLRGKPYNGCGFQWSIEKDLGCVIRGVNDYDSGYKPDFATALEVITNVLIKQVDDILKSLEGA